MSNRKKFFSNTEEDLIKRGRLFRQAIVVALIVGVLGGLLMQYKASIRWKKQKRNGEIAAQLRGAARDKFIKNSRKGDTYQFQAKKVGGSGPVNVFARVIKAGEANLFCYLSTVVTGVDSLNLSKDQLIGLAHEDTLKIAINNIPYFLLGIKSYSREHGVSLKTYSISRNRITIFIKGEKITIESIESIKGTTTCSSPFPFILEKDKTIFQITREEGITEFRIRGKVNQSKHWARRVVVNDWKSYIFLE